MKLPYADFRAELTLSAAEAAFLLEVVDEFREWICWKYGDGIREYYWEKNISETNVVIGEDEPF